jgi:hypothetical protein
MGQRSAIEPQVGATYASTLTQPAAIRVRDCNDPGWLAELAVHSMRSVFCFVLVR